MPDMSASANLAMMHATELAQELDKNKVTPGVLGFLIFAGLAVGVWFLMKSMNRHMNRISFDESSTVTSPAGGGKAAGGAASDGASADRGATKSA
ncbi:hypothetical protein [Streptomyces sp. NPDC048057]|uniref:hypothetical protein n=1 Tax=Streptomyces sp. NPDC048057 TaxID=3155628 RepID=UPI0033D17468